MISVRRFLLKTRSRSQVDRSCGIAGHCGFAARIVNYCVIRSHRNSKSQRNLGRENRHPAPNEDAGSATQSQKKTRRQPNTFRLSKLNPRSFAVIELRDGHAPCWPSLKSHLLLRGQTKDGQARFLFGRLLVKMGNCDLLQIHLQRRIKTAFTPSNTICLKEIFAFRGAVALLRPAKSTFARCDLLRSW